MDPVLLQQALSLLREKRAPLICLPKQASSDAIAAGLGLYIALGKLGKRPRVVSSGFSLPPGHSFLPKSEEILTDVSALRKFIITVDTSQAPLAELSYDLAGKQLHIYLTPKEGMYEPRHVSSSQGSFTFDLIVTLDAPTLESLGKLFDDNREFFYHTPLINIDHGPSNERYGQLALVDLTASSTAEIVYELLEAAKEPIIDETIATALLTGMISKTKSFQTPSVTPRSLTIASYLIESGARREEIIKNLYQTKSLAVLKLWGRALMRLQSAFAQRLVWTNLNPEDLADSGATLQDVPGVIDELIANTAGVEVILVLVEERERVRAFASTTKSLDALLLFKAFAPEGTKRFVTFTVERQRAVDLIRELRRAVETQLQLSA